MSPDHARQQRLGLIITLGAAVAFGIWPPAARAVYADGGNAVLVALTSMWMRAIAMGGFCLITDRRMFKNRADTWQGIIGGIFQALAVISLYKSTEYLPGPVAIIINFSHTIMLLFFMAWRGEIKLNKITVYSTLSALIGLSFVVDLWHPQPGTTWIGIAYAFFGALTTVSRLYVFGRQTQERHPIIVGAESFITAAFLLLPIMAFQMPSFPQHAAGWGFLLLGSTASILGTFGMFYGISLLGSFRYSLFLKLEPVFTALFSVWFIHEFLKPQQYVGMVMVLASLVTYQILEQRKKAMQQLATTPEA